MRRSFIISFLLFISFNGFGQDLTYARQTLNKLTSTEFWGRGYTKNGMGKAADFIESEFKSFGLQPMEGNSFRQNFSFSVNTFPGQMELSINGKKLVAGKDFIINQASTGVKTTTELIQKDSVTFLNQQHRIVVLLTDKLTWSVAQEVADFTEILVKKSALSKSPKSLSVNIENEFVPQFKAANICAMVKGTTNPDSVILMTAHYDHLGGMGTRSMIRANCWSRSTQGERLPIATIIFLPKKGCLPFSYTPKVEFRLTTMFLTRQQLFHLRFTKTYSSFL